MLIGHQIISGHPFINGRAAIFDPPPTSEREIGLLYGAFSDYRCPECEARLSGEDRICLNLCHLSVASRRRFQAALADAGQRAKRRDNLLAQGKLVEAVATVEEDNEESVVSQMAKKAKQSREKKVTTKTAQDAMRPPLSLLVKLGSIAVHVEEMLSADGHQFDRLALEAIMRDPEVAGWLQTMDSMALVPKKRRD